MFCEKIKSLQVKGLVGFDWGKIEQKMGSPRNEGISGDVYENKRRQKNKFGESRDVYENEQVIAHY